ncbi:hypothetical protein G9P44_004973 [Scheffersomyces stipitis]|nr:hypothetical protein G9P44_004973 [Scheffersomyces stipitis]
MLPIKSLISAAVLLASGAYSLDLSSTNNVALYWGQNGFGGQESLATYCQETDLDVVNLAFLNDFPDPLNLNLANACGTTFPSGLLHCPPIGEDIKTCQSLGKKVLLSLGGQYGNYGFQSTDDATSFATTLWNKFGAGTDDERPFDDAVVDGFDFDVENGNNVGYVELATELKTLFASDASKTYYLSAAPQCVFPDAGANDLLSSGLLDFAFIQFYNNPCGLDGDFNYDTWSQFAQSISANLKLFVGLPASPDAANYVDPATIKTVLDQIVCDPTFAGVSLWDASGAWANVDAAGNNFVVQVKDVLNALSCPAPSSSSEVASSSVATSSVVESSAVYENSTIASVTSEAAGATVTDIHTTVITITSCDENKCVASPVTTGYVVVTDLYTSYTTYCPLTGETPASSKPVLATTKPVVALASTPATEAPATTSSAAGYTVVKVPTGAPVAPQDVETTVVVEITSTISLAHPPIAAANISNATVPVIAQGGASSVSFAWGLIVPLAIAAFL